MTNLPRHNVRGFFININLSFLKDLNSFQYITLHFLIINAWCFSYSTQFILNADKTAIITKHILKIRNF